MNYIGNIVEGVKNTMFRFKLEVGVLILATLIALIFFGPDSNLDQIGPAVQIFLLCIPAFSLYLSATLYSEKNNIKNNATYLIYLLITAALVGYYWLLPDTFEDFSIEYIRYALFVLCSIIGLMIVPYIKSNNQLTIWNYIRLMLQRTIISGFFAGVIYIGIAIILTSLEYLFGLNITADYYFKAFVLIGILFLFWFFLGGVPKDENEDIVYTKLNKIFAEYILIPLVLIYGLILYAYGIKIIATWNWPQGGVIWLNIWFFVLGLITFLLIKPLQTGTPWVNKYIKIFSFSCIPLIILYFLAIWLRVQDYGITINRYYIILFGLWITFISFYNIISRLNSIKVIISSVLILIALSAFGPWSSLSLAKYSQYTILTQTLSKNNMLVNGKIKKAESNLADTDKSKIRGSIKYLMDIYGNESISNLIPTELEKLISEKALVSRYSIRSEIFDYIGIPEYDYADSGDSRYSNKYLYYKSNYESTLVDINGYKYSKNIIGSKMYFDKNQINGINISSDYSTETGILKITYNNNGEQQFVDLNMNDLLNKIGKEKGFSNNYSTAIDINELTIKGDSPFSYKLVLYNISGNLKPSNVVQVSSFEGLLLIK